MPTFVGALSHCSTHPQPGWIADARTDCRVWNRNPEPNPKTTINWSGACANGLAQGHGVLQWFVGGKPDQRYEGEFHDGRENGRGVLIFTNGSRYEGEYRDGTFNGHGVYSYADGGRYEGAYLDGKAHGQVFSRRQRATNFREHG